eukprot:SAG11_NODE_1624_length_4555_cov_3.452424_4_plen_71_part_00
MYLSSACLPLDCSAEHGEDKEIQVPMRKRALQEERSVTMHERTLCPVLHWVGGTTRDSEFLDGSSCVRRW